MILKIFFLFVLVTLASTKRIQDPYNENGLFTDDDDALADAKVNEKLGKTFRDDCESYKGPDRMMCYY